jgi:hypothetical protein
MLIGLGLCPGAQAFSVNEHAERITVAWNKSVHNIFEVARHCAYAQETLTREERKELIERLPFDRSRFDKLAKIGNDTRLQDSKILPLLSPHHTILADLTNLSDYELAVAVEAKVVHPKMKRRELTTWVRTRRGQRPELDPNVTFPKGIHAGLRLPANMSEDAIERFEGALLGLCEGHGVEIVHPTKRLNANKHAQFKQFKNIDSYMHREARKVIREMKRRALRGRPRHITPAHWQQMKWPFAEDETRIDDADDHDQIEWVLGFVGRADEFERIRAEAFRRS